MESLESWNLSSQGLELQKALDIEVRHIPLKRAFDIIFSLCVLILGSPVFLLIALLVLCTSRGKVVYAHKRVGRGGKSFYCYKFRSMYADADVRLKELLATRADLHEEWEKNHKLKQDPRVTPIGAFLRKTSLDEIPQFFNVLKGDLSVVGPRAVVQDELDKHFGDKAAIILKIRPGITGNWQVNGRSNTSYLARIQLDEEYVNTHNFWLDLKLILKTIPCVLVAKGAY